MKILRISQTCLRDGWTNMNEIIIEMKNEIKKCIKELENIASQNRNILIEQDKNFFSFILRKILFYKN